MSDGIVLKEMVLQEPDIYESDKRGPLIRMAMEKTGKTKRLLYKYMIQYWQRGKVKKCIAT